MMNPEAILICGKICSGKSTFAEQLCRQQNAVVLSCDELVLSILPGDLGEQHDETLARVQKYLYKKSLEILQDGSSIILEWGFWRKNDRDFARSFFTDNGFSCKIHYIDVSEEQWAANISKRNKDIERGLTTGYMVDDGLLQKLTALFETPDKEEIDFWHNY